MEYRREDNLVSINIFELSLKRVFISLSSVKDKLIHAQTKRNNKTEKSPTWKNEIQAGNNKTILGFRFLKLVFNLETFIKTLPTFAFK